MYTDLWIHRSLNLKPSQLSTYWELLPPNSFFVTTLQELYPEFNPISPPWMSSQNLWHQDSPIPLISTHETKRHIYNKHGIFANFPQHLALTQPPSCSVKGGISVFRVPCIIAHSCSFKYTSEIWPAWRIVAILSRIVNYSNILRGILLLTSRPSVQSSRYRSAWQGRFVTLCCLSYNICPEPKTSAASSLNSEVRDGSDTVVGLHMLSCIWVSSGFTTMRSSEKISV